MNQPNPDAHIRHELLDLLNGGEAHMNFEQAVENFPLDQINTIVPNGEYSAWHLLEHLRICQQDILDYIRDPDYVSPDFPVGYWPPRSAVTDGTGWHTTINQFQADLEAFRELIRNPATALFLPMPHAPKHSIFRCILVLADHNAYHIGELGSVRQTMGWWGKRTSKNQIYV